MAVFRLRTWQSAVYQVVGMAGKVMILVRVAAVESMFLRASLLLRVRLATAAQGDPVNHRMSLLRREVGESQRLAFPLPCRWLDGERVIVRAVTYYGVGGSIIQGAC